MLKFSSWLRRSSDNPHKDARALYQTLMRQSRNPAFFKQGRVADDFDGRMEVLALHLSLVMAALSRKEESGAVLSQALYDVMVADFDVALREEGLADTGVARRIKPMAKMVLTRAISYSDALFGNDKRGQIRNLNQKLTQNDQFLDVVFDYTLATWANIKDRSVGEIAGSKFAFALLP